MSLRRRRKKSEAKGRSIAIVTPVALWWKLGCWLAAVALVVLMVRVPVVTVPAATLIVAGANEQLAPTGRPAQTMVTAPLKPLTGARLMVLVAELPAVTVTAPCEVLKPKVGFALAV